MATKYDIGMVAPFFIDAVNPPPGWLYCQGGTVSGNDYPELWRECPLLRSGADIALPDMQNTIVAGGSDDTVLDVGQVGKLLTAVDFESVRVSTNAPTGVQAKIIGAKWLIWACRDTDGTWLG